MEKITQDQFDKIFDLINQIQNINEDADTSSLNMWLTMVAPECEEEDKNQ